MQAIFYHPIFDFASRGEHPVQQARSIKIGLDIAIEYDRLGLTPDQIIDAHSHLTLEAIHDALS